MLVLNEKLLFGIIIQRDENGAGTVKTFQGATCKIKGSQRGKVESALGKSTLLFLIVDNWKKKNNTISPVGTAVYFKLQTRRKNQVVAWVTYNEYKRVRQQMKNQSNRIEKLWGKLERSRYNIEEEVIEVLKNS